MSERKETGKQGKEKSTASGPASGSGGEVQAAPMTGDAAPGPAMTAAASVSEAEAQPDMGSEAARPHRGDGVAEAAREDMDDLMDRTRGVASQLSSDMRGAAEQLIEDQKARAADSMRSLAGALHRTAESLEQDNPSIAQLTDRMAERIDSACMRFRERRVSDLLADTEDFAQRRPGLFIAGAVAVGFALGRMMAASPVHDERGAD